MKKSILISFLFLSFLMITNKAKAQYDYYLGEIRMFAGIYPPTGWVFCDGQILPISQNTSALFSILGISYGGDGENNFALPDLRGRAAIQAGQGPDLSNYNLGEQGGQESITLINDNLPSHTHTASIAIQTSDLAGNTSDPTNAILANSGPFDKEYTDGEATGTLKAPNVTVGASGGNQPFNIRQPYTSVSFIIAIQGNYPPRN